MDPSEATGPVSNADSVFNDDVDAQTVELIQKIHAAANPEGIDLLLERYQDIFKTREVRNIPISGEPYTAKDKKDAQVTGTKIPCITVTPVTHLAIVRRCLGPETMAKFVGFWIDPVTVGYVKRQSRNRSVRRDLMQKAFGAINAYNQKLGVNWYSPNKTTQYFYPTNLITSGKKVGCFFQQTVEKWRPALLLAQQFWAGRPAIVALITRSLRHFEGEAVLEGNRDAVLNAERATTDDFTGLRDAKFQKYYTLPNMDTNAGGAVQGEAGFDSDDCDYLLEVGETFDHGDEEVSLYGAEGYAEGRLGRKILKGLGKAGTAIGRAIAPEFAPIYNLADRGLDKIRSGQHVDDQYVRSHFPDLASREVYDRFKHADLGSHPTVYDKNGNEVWSTISASLPELMLHAADNIEGEVEADWAMSIISPFNAGAKGSRIPNIQSTPTVTATAYTDLGAFSVAPDTQALMFTNFGALNTEPWMLINGLPNTCQDATPRIVDASGNSVEPGVIVPRVTYVAQYLSFNTTDKNILLGIRLADKPNAEGIFSSVRLASGGMRYFKTSASQDESGVIKAIYQNRGALVVKNIAQLMNYYQDDDTHVRVYTAANVHSSMGKAGFLLQANYQPIDLRECQDFVDGRHPTINNVTRMLNGQWVQMSHLGPVRILIAFSTPPANFNGNNWQPGVFYVYDETIREAMEADPACVLSEFGVDGYSLAASHITIQAFEGVSATTTFEFQFVQHFEGIPSSSSQFLETKACSLGNDYATPLDILRRFKFSDFMVGEGRLMNDPTNHMIRGERDIQSITSPTEYSSMLDPLSQHSLTVKAPLDQTGLHTGLLSSITGKFLAKAGDIGHKVLDHLHRNKTLKQAIAQQLPMVLEKLLMRLNVDQIKRQEILRAAEDKAKELLHIQGEGVCVAEDISGRYKIDPPTQVLNMQSYHNQSRY